MRIADYYPNSIVNGEGVRQVLFTQGCKHHCEGCHNPQTWDMEEGTNYSTKELVSMLLENPYDLTISGGEPFLQITDLIMLCVKLHGFKNIWVYTGYTYEQIIQSKSLSQVLPFIDVLVDGRFDIGLRDTSLVFRGSSNQRIIDVPKSLQAGEVVLLCGTG